MKKTFAAMIAISTLMISSADVYAIADSARAACVINAATSEIVFEKNADERLPMASTTKIMTAYTALKSSTADEAVKISINAQNQEGSSMYAKAGDSVAMLDMLYGLMLNSGNDAAVAIAEHVSGDIESFAQLMNKNAAEMGAMNTSFRNPNGLHDESHFTTAADLALITCKAMEHAEFRGIVKTQSYSASSLIDPQKKYELYNHNKLLKSYDGAVGVKTGYTKAAGRCLVSAAERDGMMFIAVTLNDPDDWNTHKELLDSAFASHYPVTAVKRGECIKKLVRGGKTYTLSAQESVTVPVKENAATQIGIEVHMASNLDGAINKGERVGCIDVFVDGIKTDTVAVTADNDIADTTGHTLHDSFYMSWRNIWRMLLI